MADLTVDRMIRIMNDEVLKQPQREKGPEVDKFLEEFRKDLAQMKKDGHILEIPPE